MREKCRLSKNRCKMYCTKHCMNTKQLPIEFNIHDEREPYMHVWNAQITRQPIT